MTREWSTREDEPLREAVAILRKARRTVVLTGAGISVPSGIPDFRSPSSGLWERHDPAEVASLHGFRSQPKRFFDWLRPLLETTRRASPNAAHVALATMQKEGFVKEIVTQNIDGLHEEAGSANVLAVHGHIRTATCLDCGVQQGTAPLWEAVLQSRLPHCERCGGVFKPDVVLFGEMLPAGVLAESQRAVRCSDVMLVVGSSLSVYPVAALPQNMLDQGGQLILMNLGPTEYDRRATVKIEADVVDALPCLLQLLQEA